MNQLNLVSVSHSFRETNKAVGWLAMLDNLGCHVIIYFTSPLVKELNGYGQTLFKILVQVKVCQTLNLFHTKTCVSLHFSDNQAASVADTITNMNKHISKSICCIPGSIYNFAIITSF